MSAPPPEGWTHVARTGHSYTFCNRVLDHDGGHNGESVVIYKHVTRPDVTRPDVTTCPDCLKVVAAIDRESDVKS